MGYSVAGVEYIDGVDRITVERIEIRTALRILEGYGVGNQGDEDGAAGLITPKSIHIRPIEPRQAADEWSLAMAGGGTDNGHSCRHAGSRASDEALHGLSP